MWVYIYKGKIFMKSAIRGDRGVASLMEILIIVVVLGILVAASVVTFTGARDRTRIRQAAQAVSEVLRAMEMYRAEQQTYPLAFTDTTQLYNTLSGFGYDALRLPEHCSYISYTSLSAGENYRLVVQAFDRSGTPITATITGLQAVMGGQDLRDLIN